MLPRPIYALMHLLLVSPALLVPAGLFLWILADGPCAWYAGSCNVVFHVHLVIFGVPVIVLSILWLGFVNGRVVDRSPWARLERTHLAAAGAGVERQTCPICGWDYAGREGDTHSPCPGKKVPVRISRRTRRWLATEERQTVVTSG